MSVPLILRIYDPPTLNASIPSKFPTSLGTYYQMFDNIFENRFYHKKEKKSTYLRKSVYGKNYPASAFLANFHKGLQTYVKNARSVNTHLERYSYDFNESSIKYYFALIFVIYHFGSTKRTDKRFDWQNARKEQKLQYVPNVKGKYLLLINASIDHNNFYA